MGETLCASSIIIRSASGIKDAIENLDRKLVDKIISEFPKHFVSSDIPSFFTLWSILSSRSNCSNKTNL